MSLGNSKERLSCPCHVPGWRTEWKYTGAFSAHVIVASPGMVEILVLCWNLEGYTGCLPLLVAERLKDQGSTVLPSAHIYLLVNFPTSLQSGVSKGLPKTSRLWPVLFVLPLFLQGLSMSLL